MVVLQKKGDIVTRIFWGREIVPFWREVWVKKTPQTMVSGHRETHMGKGTMRISNLAPALEVAGRSFERGVDFLAFLKP